MKDFLAIFTGINAYCTWPEILPNSSRNYFSLLITEPVSIKVMDALGRIVEKKDKIHAKNIVKLGSQYRQGLYYAEVIQGTNRVVLKLLKMAE